MYKKLVSFIIFSFLSLQTFSFFHLAEFGFEEHEHDDEVCEIYLYCEQSKDNISKSEILSQNHEYFTFKFVSKKDFLIFLKKYKLILTRAPPQFS
tara:strand:+ start:16401 stop:16685 length:285 start_codon:yes stop_codon:yes gene_type:complete